MRVPKKLEPDSVEKSEYWDGKYHRIAHGPFFDDNFASVAVEQSKD